MISYKCTKCGSKMKSAESMIGRTEVCPACRAMNVIPKSGGMKMARWFAGQKLVGPAVAALVCLTVLAVLAYLVASGLSSGGDLEVGVLKQKLAMANSEYEAQSKELKGLQVDIRKLQAENEQLKRTVQRLTDAAAAPRPHPAASEGPPVPAPVEPIIATPMPPRPPMPVEPLPAPPPAPVKVAAGPRVEPLAVAEQEKVKRMIAWLQKNITCISCLGKGEISGNCCGDCAEKLTRQRTIRRKVPTGGQVWNSALNGYVAEYVWREIVEEYQVGNGKTPLAKLRPTLSLVLGSCQQYRDTMPTTLMAQARGICVQIDPAMAADFAAVGTGLAAP